MKAAKRSVSVVLPGLCSAGGASVSMHSVHNPLQALGVQEKWHSVDKSDGSFANELVEEPALRSFFRIQLFVLSKVAQD